MKEPTAGSKADSEEQKQLIPLLGKQVLLLFPLSLSRDQTPRPGTRTEFKIPPQRLNFILIHQHELDLQTLRQLSLNIMTHRSVIYFLKKKNFIFPFYQRYRLPHITQLSSICVSERIFKCLLKMFQCSLIRWK